MKITPLRNSFNLTFEDISSDKSISHRCVIFSLLCDGISEISNYLEAQDCMNTLEIAKQLGAKIKKENGIYLIDPPSKILSPNSVLDCGNSGTAMRIYIGLLSSVDGFFILNGDEYLNQRPMKRVVEPLVKIGAKIDGRDGANKAPLAIRGSKLKYFDFKSNISSAQVKTSLILAGLLGEGCKFSEPELSRDHSEKILKNMGANIIIDGLNLEIKPLNEKKLKPLKLTVPNDPSSCFFYAVAACIIPGSKIIMKNVLLNKTRIEAYKILEKMGAKILYKFNKDAYEDIGEISVEYSPLNAIEVDKNISWMIDEAPALAIAFACAKGTSILRNAAELRVKECDRIAVSVLALKQCGIQAEELEDGFIITGGEPKNATIDSHGDHRIAMSFAILGLKCAMVINNSEFISTSFPKFTYFLRKFGAEIED